ncbi:hypothetical protein [Nannocystis pusilla]|uniref:hypothetical protein n=1 Tax=Nannocystis pusilla TaxID=889268 RepID=UPI003B786B2C
MEAQPDGAIHVAFAVPPEAVLLRRGLVLSQGTAADLLADLQPPPGPTLEHLQVWADSPNLRTTMARDKVVDDPGRAAVLGKIAQAIAGLRERLVERTAEAAAEAGPWTRARHDHYAYLHAHLARERSHLGAGLLGRPVLRDLAGERALSLAQLQALARPLLWAPLGNGEAATGRLLAAAAGAGCRSWRPRRGTSSGSVAWSKGQV